MNTAQLIKHLTAASFTSRLELSFEPMQSPMQRLNGDDVYALTRKFEGPDALIAEVNADLKRLEQDPTITAYGLHVLELIQSASERTAKLLRYGKSIRKCGQALA